MDPDALHVAPTDSLIRLASYLGCASSQREAETIGPWRHRIVHAILRRIKRARVVPRR